MGNKKGKGQVRVQQSMGQLVSRAALAQMGPQIEQLVQQSIQRLGGQLAMQTANTMETLFSRIVVLENIVEEKLGYTKSDLANKVSDIEDSKDDVLEVKDGTIEKDDVVRLEVKTKTKDQDQYQGSSKLKISKTGSGQTLGEELEKELLGMKTGEVKTVQFGENKQMVAEFTINRISRADKSLKQDESKELENENQSQG